MKKIRVFAIAAVMAAAAMAAGCGSAKEPEASEASEASEMSEASEASEVSDASEISIEMIEGKEALIELKNASDGNSVESGTLTIGEGESLEIESKLNEGSKVLIELAAVPENQEDDENAEFGEPVVKETIEQSGTTNPEAAPADYQVRVTAQSKSDGKISMHVTKAEEQESPKEKAIKENEDKAKEAAEKAGFDVPVLYGVETSLGLLGVKGREITYASEEGIVQITCPVAKENDAKEKIKGKILVTIGRFLDEGENYPGKLSFDDNTDVPNWEMEGLEETVTCYGENGDATPKVTKAGWETDDLKYEIRVESDDNSISLTQEDVVTMVNAIMHPDDQAK